MFNINRKHKKQYIAPVIEFEMMEEEGALMETQGSFPDQEETPSDKDPFEVKGSDFIFDDEPEPIADEISW